MLKKNLVALQWISLLLLGTGVICVQLQPTSNDAKDLASKPIQNPWVGFTAGVVACVLTGFAGIYFEKILKSTSQSIFVRNIQLGVIGIFAGLAGVLISDGVAVKANGFFFGYDVFVWIVVVIHGIGGILVAAVQKYADNILKGFAASGAIVIAAVISVFMFDFQLSVQFVVGAICVMFAVFVYSGLQTVTWLLPTCCIAEETSTEIA